MSFFQPAESIYITDLADDSFSLLDSQPNEAESGWDTLKNTYLLRDVSAGNDPVAAISSRWMRGTQLSGRTMYVTDRTPKCIARGLFRVDVTYKGMLSSRGYKVTYDAAGSQQSGGPVAIGGTTYPKVSVGESAVTAQFEYISTVAVSALPTDLAGTAASLPSGWAPDVRASIWATIVDPTYHYPNGWVLDRVGCENIPGVDNIWLVTLYYIYVYPYSI